MKSVIFLLSIVGVALSAPSGTYHALPLQLPAAAPMPVMATKGYYAHAPVLREQVLVQTPTFIAAPTVTGTLQSSQDSLGQYAFSYSSSDGQQKSESKNLDGGVSGSFSYIAPEGKRIHLTYVADRDGGFRAIGDHLPEAPEVPEMPDDLKEAYKEAHDRLEKAYEEARLRGDDLSSDDGSYKEIEVERPLEIPQLPIPAQIPQQLPLPAAPILNTYVAAPAPLPILTHKTYTAALPVKSSFIKVPILPVAAPAPVPEPPTPAPYTSVSYSTNLGAPAKIPVVAAAPAPAITIPVSSGKKSGYTFTGY